MASKRFSLVRGRAMRVTRLDACGAPVLGPDSVVVSKGFISVGLTANTEEGESISLTNANGDICISDEPCPQFTGYSLEVQFCGVDPDLISLMTNQNKVTDSTPEEVAVGFRMNSGVDVCGAGFALEVWSSVPQGACEVGEASYGYFLVPFVKGGILGDFSIENAAVNFTMTGASSKDGSGWGVGPFNVVRDAANLPAPLKDPIDSRDHLHMELSTVAPPVVSESGAIALGTPATGAEAGSPGAFTPDNSYGPQDFEELSTSGITASPATAWGTGEYVVLRDGSTAHWDGVAWVEGPA